MKKSILLVATLVVIMASFVACKNEEPVASEPASSSEVPSEEVSSEEVSEEASSEEVAGEYSADAIMKLVDELTAKYQYNDPEHIKALVIAANLEYIAAEDLDTLLTVYGYSMENLATLYDEFLVSNENAMSKSVDCSNGHVDAISPEETYENRIRMQDVMIDPTNAEFCAEYDDMLIKWSNSESVTTHETQDKVYDFVTNSSTPAEISNLDNFVYGYTVAMWRGIDAAELYFVNPYAHYQNAN